MSRNDRVPRSEEHTSELQSQDGISYAVFCLKMGTAYRLAAGANFEEKLLGLMQTIGVAFANFSPGLDPFDWLIGFVGAVAFRLLIYFKSKNAKKYRRGVEYGSARWSA